MPDDYTIEYECFNNMFENCSSLNHIKINIRGIIYPELPPITSNWVKGVASSGVIEKNSDLVLETGDSGIPNGWTVSIIE